MKRFFYLVVFAGFLSLPIFAGPAQLLDIDFTRDSTTWKPLFPEPAYSTDSSNYLVSVTDHTAGDFNFLGSFGRFRAGANDMAQPCYIENRTKFRRWAFRLGSSGEAYVELPELQNVGRFTVFCKNANVSSETPIYIQKKNGESWETIRTIYLPPHHNQNYELEMEEFLNINAPVKLRILGSTRNIFIYQIRVDAYDASLPKEKPLKIVLIPDAQSYANQPDLNHIYGIMTMWINNIADDVKFVIQQGDITQLNDAAQWNIAAGAYNLLEGRKIPFSYCAGNHDMGRHGNSRNTTNMNTYLPASRYNRYDWYGGTFEPNTVDNTWQTFSRGDYKFLVLSLEYLPRNKVLAWANTVIADHPNHNVIINTHSYLGAGNTLNTGIPQEELNGTGDETPNNGKAIWEKLVSKHKNCLFVFSGHVLGDGAGYLVSNGEKGNKVYQFIANYQGGVDGSQESRNGMIRIVDLDPENKRFSIQTYSPYQNRYNTNVDHEYYYTNVNFIKDGEPEIYEPEPTGILSEDFSSTAWENELKRLNPGGGQNSNAPNPNAYATPIAEGANAYIDLNSTDLYFDKYRMVGAIESLAVQPCAAVEDIEHNNNGLAVAFRFLNSNAGLFEFPEVPNAGTITLHVRNGNLNNNTWLALERYENGNWVNLKTFELHSNAALRTSKDEILSYDIASESPVKLRLRNAGTRYINLYRVSVGSYDGLTAVPTTQSPVFKQMGRRLIVESPTRITLYNLQGTKLFDSDVENETVIPENITKGIYIVNTNKGAQKIILNQ